MAFQPFGFRFAVDSALPPAEAKAAIRAAKKRWFDTRAGARGWIAGPFICLWARAFDKNGPMLIGRISSNNFGTRIAGRAGSDLNGVYSFTLLLPLLAFLSHKMTVEGLDTFRIVVMLSFVFMIALLVFWFSHENRREAEPIVEFLRNVLAPDGRLTKRDSLLSCRRLALTVDGRNADGNVTLDAIQGALDWLAAEGIVIVASESECYLQTVLSHGGFILEKREGSAAQHYRAVHSDAVSSDRRERPDLFSKAETLAVFHAYAAQSAMPEFVNWELMQLGS